MARNTEKLIARNKLMAKYPRGETETRLYHIWSSMKARCYTKSNNAYGNYGGRGVCVCPEWRNDYLKFKEWAMAHGYKESLTIDRINPFGDYEPSNCRWATTKEQSVNKRKTILPTDNGITKPLVEWADILGVSVHTLYARQSKGWADREVLYGKRRIGAAIIKCDGVEKPLSEWARETNQAYGKLASRYRRGWSHNEVVYGRRSEVDA